MRLNDVQPWSRQSWTKFYEAALFESDKVKLCILIWNAQLAIVGRRREIRNRSGREKQELVALKKALEILQELGRLSGLENLLEGTIVFTRTGFSNSRSRHLGRSLTRRVMRKS